MINYTSKPKKAKLKKITVIIACAVVFVFAAVSAVGLIASSDSEKRRSVSGAVEENAQLKAETEKQRAEIEELNKKIEALEDELKKYPSPSPTPFKIENKTSEKMANEEKVSPRDATSKENTSG